MINSKLGRIRKTAVISFALADIAIEGKKLDNLKNKSFPDKALGKSKKRVLASKCQSSSEITLEAGVCVGAHNPKKTKRILYKTVRATPITIIK